MVFRKAAYKDIGKFVDVRVEFATLIRKIDNADSFRSGTADYLAAHIDKDDLVIYIALDGSEIVSSCMACIFQTAPLPSCPTGKTAELLNVYTKAGYRRKGFAHILLTMLLNELREKGVQKVVLEHTEEGFPLYQKLGFTAIEHRMQKRL